jgi:cell division inhibitor SepF
MSFAEERGRPMGAWRKAGVWLGLVEDDDDRRYVDDDIDPYEDEFDEPAPPPRVRPERLPSRPVTRAPVSTAAPITHDNLALAPQIALRERAVLPEEDAAYRITTLHPTTYNEARTIGEQFREGIPVILNLTEMDESDAKRLVDFAAGLTFGLRGSIERVTNRVFLLSPANVTVTAEDKARIAEGGFFNQS